ncbi:hypothetical protein F2Q69_00063894 [Brassica cretica]|uniref:Coenzyme Q-binding protein COQ10 START domain-containing protein n=1 Tax=Brassica cretica TaxID=69181 RepID=A0A8S9RJS8_BRACR|nr:hypothetical protein F2Q69_00063894 [Brassica cretica]
MSVTVTHMNTINHVSKTCKIPKFQLPICFNRRLAFPSPRKLYPYPQLHPKTVNGSSRFNTRKRTSVSMEWQDCIVKMEVDVPASVAYNFYLYLDPESLPKLMPFISSVEPVPNQKIHWRSVEGLPNKGSVRFFPKGPSSCIVQVNHTPFRLLQHL